MDKKLKRQVFFVILGFGLLITSAIVYKVLQKKSIDYVSIERHFPLPAKQVDGNWGYIDKDGEWVIKPQFTAAKYFSSIGLAAVSLDENEYNKLWGLIDKSGNMIYYPQFPTIDYLSKYDKESPFIACELQRSRGLYDEESEKCILIDSTGQIVNDTQFEFVDYFCATNQLARVKINGKYGFINQKGDIVIEPIYDYSAFKWEDTLYVLQHKGDKGGYIDKTGKWLWSFSFVDFDQFEGHNRAYCGFTPFKKNNKWGFVNKNGTIIKPSFDAYDEFEEHTGLARVQYNGKWGLINTKGDYVIKPLYEDIKKLYINGFVGAKINNKWGLVDHNDNIIIQPQYDDISYNESTNIIAVKNNDKWGFIDIKGTMIMNTIFDDQKCYGKSGYYIVKQNEMWGVVDTIGKVVVQPKFKSINSFNDDMMAEITNSNRKKGFIDTKGNYVIEPLYDDIWNFDKRDVTIVQQNDLYGLINKKGDLVVKPQFESVYRSSYLNDIIFVKRENKWGIIDYKGNWIIMPNFGGFDNYDYEYTR